MKNILTIITLMALTLGLQAQDGVNKPLSQYGLGLGNGTSNMPVATAMGGVAYTTAANNIVNPYNPASYAAIQKESFVFDMGFGVSMVTQRDADSKLFDGDGNVAYVSVAFPLTRWWKTALSLQPLSDMSYQSVNTAALPGVDSGTVRTSYAGTGGVTRILWGHAFNIVPDRLALGFNVNFYHGYISREINYIFSAPDTLPQYMNVCRQKVTLIRNFTFDAGLQYFQPLGKDYLLGIGLTAATPRTMTVSDNALVRTFVLQNGYPSYRDTIFPNRGESPEYQSTLKMPLQVGLGLSLQHNAQWRVALDMSYAAWSGTQYEDNQQLFGSTAVVYDRNLRGALGFQMLGDMDAAAYARRITYSAGVHYEQGKLRLDIGGNNHCLNEWGFGFGASLPMRKGKSSLTISAGYSSFGTGDLLRQSAFTIGVGLGSCESWFVKKKYN